MEYRLKCDCFNGFYPGEYIIAYKGPKNLEWYFVPVTDVIRKEYTGLARIAVLDENSETCLVEVNDVVTKDKSKFWAYKKDIIKEE